MTANDTFFTNIKVLKQRKFLKEGDIQISVNGKSNRNKFDCRLCAA